MLKSLPNGRLHLSASNKVFNWFSAEAGTIASERWETLNKAQAYSFVQKTGKCSNVLLDFNIQQNSCFKYNQKSLYFLFTRLKHGQMGQIGVLAAQRHFNRDVAHFV